MDMVDDTQMALRSQLLTCTTSFADLLFFFFCFPDSRQHDSFATDQP